MPTTLKDIAREAGVSEATVSRALNPGRASVVKPATCARILDIANALGYRHNPHAQALAGGKCAVVSLVVAYTEDYMMNVKALALHASLVDLGLQPEIHHPQRVNGSQTVDEIAANLLRSSPIAVVLRTLASDWSPELLAELSDAIWRQGVHVLLVDHHQLPADDVPADVIASDRPGASAAAVSHLVDLGHRHIGLLALADQGFGRLEGYAKALDERGIADRYVEPLSGHADLGDGSVMGRPTVEAGRGAAKALLTRHPQVTAIYCASDLVALGAMEGLAEIGRRVPDDVAVIGLNDEPWCAHLPVPLSTLAQPVEELSARAAEMLQERLDGYDGPWHRELVPMTLVARTSTAGSESPS
ncbi:MAG TPA: LacI family DNA-binding transcriptional regulator [Armatimonadota bacterium]|nr:LacI family DNA-binding transcriptional regulator [Armatimonadota bacterium]